MATEDPEGPWGLLDNMTIEHQYHPALDLFAMLFDNEEEPTYFDYLVYKSLSSDSSSGVPPAIAPNPDTEVVLT